LQTLKEIISLYDAKSIILSHIKKQSVEEVLLTESLGRFLAEDIIAPYPLPQNDNSAMDGYAVKSEDLKDASIENAVKLKVVEVITAGKKPAITIRNGQCARIFTGAIIPEGADAVIRQEDVIKNGEYILVSKHVEPKTDIRERGSDLAEGEKVLSAGDRISPAIIGLLASLRKSRLKVYKSPSVYIIATGNELVDIDSPYDNFTIVNSNSYSISAMAKELNAIPYIGGIIKDTKESIRQCFERAIEHDIVITTGGVSVGEYDLVKEVFAEMGVKWLFWKVKIRPGHPIAFGVYNDKIFFGLPGNPVSAMVTFDQFVRPAILKMCGHEHLEREKIKAKCLSKIKKKSGVIHFIRGIFSVKNGEIYVESIDNQSSSAINVMAKANCYIILNENETRVEPGDTVLIEIFKKW